jgi:plasmid segregation protein ParM
MGAGNTKISAVKDGKPVLDLVVPSAVGMVGSGSLSGFRDGSTSPHDVRLVINNNEYCVSLRPNQEFPRYKRATPHDDYQRSAQHDALLSAALRTADLTRIDMLVLGAPVQTYMKHKAHLATWKGYRELGSGMSVDIRNVLCLPQPFGTLAAAKKEHVIDPREHVNHIVIDVGFYSVDVLKTHGYEIQDSHSFGLGSGTAAVYRKIADMLAATLRKPVNDIDRIEHALRTGQPCMVHGQSLNLKADYLGSVEAYVEEIAREIYARLESTEDVSSILLTGGGCDLFDHAIRKVFHNIAITRMPDPIRANVRGYAIAGHAALSGV